MKKKGFTVTYTLEECDKDVVKIYSEVINNYLNRKIVNLLVKYYTRKKSVEKRRVQAIVKRAKKKLITKTQKYDTKRKSNRTC